MRAYLAVVGILVIAVLQTEAVSPIPWYRNVLTLSGGEQRFIPYADADDKEPYLPEVMR
jgi:hypothetical protein